MKRHLILFTTCLCMSAPLVAQDAYSSDSESDGNNRHFNFNPGNMMNSMSNPMRSMFGSSRRNYDDYGYPGAGYPPPAYPPAYGYPGYQAAPYPGYGHPNQPAPAPAQATPYAYPSAVPAPAAPATPYQAQPQAQPTPAQERPPAAAQQYKPDFSQPDSNSNYRFRPLDGTAAPAARTTAPAPVEDATAAPAQQVAPASGAAAPVLSTPMAPFSYPPAKPAEEPMAPISYPDPAPSAPASPPPMTQAPAATADPDLRFRPLDKPGYSSELGQ